VNHPPLPLPLDGQSNGTIRILDQQVALGNTYLFGSNKILDARLGISRSRVYPGSIFLEGNRGRDRCSNWMAWSPDHPNPKICARKSST
jgi:hypothetical protein